MKSNRVIIHCLLLALAASTLQPASLFAQGTAFTYQGRLNDASGPATGSFDLRFALYDAASGGTQQGSLLTNAATAVSNGQFTVTLDFGSQFPGANRWLEIGVRGGSETDFTTLVPRQALAATPYAITAQNLNGTVAASQISGNLSASSLGGTLSVAQLPSAALTNYASGVTLSGVFVGNGAGVTNVNLMAANTAGAISWITNYGNFVPGATPGAGNYPVFVASADVNGDGKQDMVCANLVDSTLTVLTNNGSGNFAISASPGVGSNPFGVVAADVNGDGKPDLISANYGANSLTVLTNNGSGRFTLSATLNVGLNPQSVTAAYLNGDGWIDLVCANNGANTLTVLTNNAHGGFAISSSPAVGSSPFFVTAADVNSDGRMDLISANFGANTLTLLTNNGTGGFALSSSPAVGNGPYAVAAADVTGDGRIDLVCANNNANTLTVLVNNGNGSFTVASSPAVGSAPTFVLAADVTGDGRPDLISVNNAAGTLTVLGNLGNGNFTVTSSPGVGTWPQNVVAADVSGDGRLDLVCANYGSHTLSVLTNTSSYQASFTGNGAGLTSLNASQITSGMLPVAQLPAVVLTNNASGVSLAGSFAGNGAGLTNLPLPTGIASLNSNQIFNASNTFAGAVVASNASNVIAGTFTGSGAGLTSLNPAAISSGTAGINISGNAATATTAMAALTAGTATNLLGTVADAQLSANIARINGTNVFTGVLIATNPGNQFTGTFIGSGAGLTSLNPAAISFGTAGINITGNAATATTAAVAGSAVTANSAASATTATTAMTALTALTAGTATNLLGTVADAQLSANIARINGTNVFTGTNTFASVLIATNPANLFTGTFIGSGAGLTGLSAISLAAGSITADKLAPGAVSSLGALDGSPTNAVQMNTNGLVGIGTSTPAAGLQITTGAPVATLTTLFEVQDGTGSYTNLAEAWMPVVSGSLLAVSAQYDSAVTLVNIANPSSPLLRAQIRDGTGVFTNLAAAQGLAWAGSNLVVAAYNSSAVTIIACTNPASPVKLAELRDGVGGWNLLGGASSVAVSGNLLAIGSGEDNAVTLADISNPSAPVLRGYMQDGFNGFTNLASVRSVALAGNLLAIGSYYDNAVTLVNVSDPANPVKLAELRYGVGGYTNLSYVQSVALSGNLLAIAALDSGAVTLVDVSNPASPMKLAELRDGVGGYVLGQPNAVALSGNRLAIAALYSSTATLVDVSNPANPVLLTTAKDNVNGADFLNGASGVAFAGTNLVVVGQSDSAFTILGIQSQQVGLASAGWVGIGTTLPVAPLSVEGNVVVENASQFNVQATHVALGNRASASGSYAIALGNYTTASGSGSTALGNGSMASGEASTALGVEATASGDYSSALGYHTTASGYASAALGSATVASGNGSTALGNAAWAIGEASTALGHSTWASGYASTALGYQTWASGYASTALGYASVATNFSMATGAGAQALHSGSFVWADYQLSSYGSVQSFASTATNQFLIRASGGVGIGLTNPTAQLHVSSSGGEHAPQVWINETTTNGSSVLRFTSGGDYDKRWDVATQTNRFAIYSGQFGNDMLVLDSGGLAVRGTFVSTSDRNAKENFWPVDAQEVLGKVASLPLSRWNYKQDAISQHIGPMAQDFYAAFNVGPDDKHITTVDESGVALAAIQGLNAKLEKENAELKARLEKLEQIVGTLTGGAK